MGQIDFNTFKQNLQNQNNRNTNTNEQTRGKYVGYFSLKNDKDQAIVRIMIDSPEQLKIVGIHRVTVGGRLRAVNCMRDPREPIENCPFCAADKRLEYRVYIPVIEYTRDDQGKVRPRAKVWERSALYVDTITNLIDNYGPLSDSIFKIIRNGESGSKNTTYDIMYGNPSVYKPELYPKDETLFEGYEVIGTTVLDPTVEEAAQILQGITPERFQFNQNNNTFQNKSSNSTTTISSAGDYRPTSTPVTPATPVATNVVPETPSYTAPRANPMSGVETEQTVRPRRYFN